MRNINIGVLLSEQIDFILHGRFVCNGHATVSGACSVTAQGHSVLWQGEPCNRVSLVPLDDRCRFTLQNVVIGLDFHWERLQDQKFEGELLLFVEDGRVRAVNSLPVEKYLKSVISSEMSAASSTEFLKAHTIISRSWLYAQLQRGGVSADTVLGRSSDDEIIRWYARENHTLFDLCADDHCQRYQGVPTVCNHEVESAVAATENIVLAYEGQVCDARFSKCCGGMTERFSACWEDADMGYLQAFRDCAGKEGFVDLTDEQNARRWIQDAPPAFCNTLDKEILLQVLNGYDRETNDFYRWTVRYTQSELSDIVATKSGIDFGLITALTPVERAASGRIVRLRITGSKRTMVVGKELEIRRLLSPTHLYSSAFVVDMVQPAQDTEPLFVINGAGWGHGVGLCQIGAAMMGERGYSYKEILSHYYPDATLENIENLSNGNFLEYK